MNTKVPVWSGDGWEGIYEAAHQEEQKRPDVKVYIKEELIHVPYTGDNVKAELSHPNVVDEWFSCDLPCELFPRNGVIEFGADVKPNLDLNGDGIDDTIEAVVRYLYSVPKMYSDTSDPPDPFDKEGNYLFPPVNAGPQVVDMRTFTGVVIQNTFMFGDCKHYYVNGKLHREEGPAIESLDGDMQAWYVNGTRHRDGAPAFIVKGNRQGWYRNGKLHRETGPAMEYFSPPARAGQHEYYLNGKEYNKKEWNSKTSLSRALKTITNYAKILENAPPGSITKSINQIIQNDDYVKIKSATDLLTLDKIAKEGGSRCQNCNEFNEYVADPHYVCYSCKNG